MKAVIFARVSTKKQEKGGHSIDSQITKLRQYCDKNNIEVIREIYGKVNLAEINFSEQTVVLGVDLDFKKDIKYIDEESLKYLLPKDDQKQNILFCGLSWQYQLFSRGYPQQHEYPFFEIIENCLAEESSILKEKFKKIIASDSENSFDDGINLAKIANPDWSIELIYGFNLLERLVQRKLNNPTKKDQPLKGQPLYKKLLENESFKQYLEDYSKDSGNEDYYFALRAMERTMGDNYRNILAHDLFVECLDMKDSNVDGNNAKYAMWQYFSHRFWSDIKNIKKLYQFIQNWDQLFLTKLS